MSRPVSGEGGSGTVVTYRLAGGEVAMVETLSFKVTTDGTAGAHAVRVTLTQPTVGIVARLDDLNGGGPSQTNYYTYGLGLEGTTCDLPDGIAVTDPLPWTELQPGATITLEAIDGTGAQIAGDHFADVLLQLSDAAQVAPPASGLPLVLLPGSPLEQAA
jgi:hypothetical protein